MAEFIKLTPQVDKATFAYKEFILIPIAREDREEQLEAVGIQLLQSYS
jgi:hypothetical protein